jgi:hypothetical protein
MQGRLSFIGVAAMAAAIYCGTLSPVFAQQSQKPNVVLMLMDNLGYGELGVYGGGILRGAPTPNTPIH